MNICRTCIWYSENIKDKKYEDLPLCIQHTKSKAYIKDSQKRNDLHCVNCSCKLELKTRVPAAHCPLTDPKWPSVATDDESFLIETLTE